MSYRWVEEKRKEEKRRELKNGFGCKEWRLAYVKTIVVINNENKYILNNSNKVINYCPFCGNKLNINGCTKRV